MANRFGLLNINKPRGETSRWVVDQVQWLVHPAKVGHAGTLDPLATGVLIVCVGPATRLVDYIQQMRKRYRAEFLLGRTSPTEDTDGEVTELENPPMPSRAKIEAAARKLLGEIQQRPPAYSALKLKGRRAYRLARKGHDVQLQSRTVTIHRLEVVDYDYPCLTLDIECSSGTYVRSLGRDLAESLGSGAVMSALERTAIGNFRVEDAIGVKELSRENLPAHLLPPLRAVEHLSKLQLNADEIEQISRGQFIPYPNAAQTIGDQHEIAATDEGDNLVALLRRQDQSLRPICNFRTS